MMSSWSDHSTEVMNIWEKEKNTDVVKNIYFFFSDLICDEEKCLRLLTLLFALCMTPVKRTLIGYRWLPMTMCCSRNLSQSGPTLATHLYPLHEVEGHG